MRYYSSITMWAHNPASVQFVDNLLFVEFSMWFVTLVLLGITVFLLISGFSERAIVKEREDK